MSAIKLFRYASNDTIELNYPGGNRYCEALNLDKR